MTVSTRPSVAVIGSGVSGLTAAYLLSRTHEVSLFEADNRLGGHAHTHALRGKNNEQIRVDSGFIVHNDKTYPLLRRLFAELEVELNPTEMSMSIHCQGCGLEFAGGRGLSGILAQPYRLRDPKFLRLLMQVRRFHRRATTFMRTHGDEDVTTYGDFLADEGFSDHFISHYAIPVVSCVWSSGRADVMKYPARYLFRFLDQHGLLRVTGSPQWYTVVGGSSTYVEKLVSRLSDVRTSRAVTGIIRNNGGVQVHDICGDITKVDRVVIATHPHQALNLLIDPTDNETEVLSAFEYAPNTTVLHTDSSLLSNNRSAQASWNYKMSSCDSPEAPPVVTYWMNRLQGLTSAKEYLVTLNATYRINPDEVLATMNYEHPIYTAHSVAAQSKLQALATDRTVYAGAYHGWGFHEDGCRSGVLAAEHFGVKW